MIDEQKALAEQLQSMQRKNQEEGKEEISAILARRGLVLIGLPQYVQKDGAWVTIIQVGVVPAKEDT